MAYRSSRQHTVVINIYVRPDQYDWLREHGNYSVLLRELIDAAMYDPSTIGRGELARVHRAIRELDTLLSQLRAASEAAEAPRRQRTRARQRGGHRTLDEQAGG
jgi:hypothetical protein